MVNFTVLVCNRPRLTKQMFASLEGTTNVTYMISEDRKCDGETSQAITEFQAKNPDTVILGHTAEYGTGSLRNQVIRASEKYFGRGDYLYLSDNDVKFRQGWLATLLACYDEAWRQGFKVLGAYNHPYHIPFNPTRICVWQRPEILASGNIPSTMATSEVQVDNYGVSEVHALALQSMLMRWEVWDKYGPFDETPPGRVRMSEDVAFTNKIKADGGRIGVVSPPLLVNTGITDSFGEKIPGWELVKAQCPEDVICE